MKRSVEIPKLNHPNYNTIFWLTSLRESSNVNAVKELASNLLDKKKLKNEKQKQSKVTHPHGHSFNAVVHLKRQPDAQDPLLIFEQNGEGMNENSSHVFKCSKFLAKIALEMDRSGKHYMSKEWGFFYAAHKRC